MTLLAYGCTVKHVIPWELRFMNEVFARSQNQGEERLLLSRPDAAYALHISTRKLDELVAEKLLKARRIGNRVLFTPAELQRFAQGR